MRRAWRLLAAAGALAALAWLRPAAQDGLPPARHEATDVGLRPMLLAGALVLLGLGGMLALAALLYPGALADRAIRQPLPVFPAPQLQADPAADMAAFRAGQLRQLNAAGWIDRGAGTVHLPIAQAMQDVARRGIPDWPAQ